MASFVCAAFEQPQQIVRTGSLGSLGSLDSLHLAVRIGFMVTVNGGLQSESRNPQP